MKKVLYFCNGLEMGYGKPLRPRCRKMIELLVLSIPAVLLRWSAPEWFEAVITKLWEYDTKN